MGAPAFHVERRTGERRGQRRDVPPEESWFGAFTASPDSQTGATLPPGGPGPLDQDAPANRLLERPEKPGAGDATTLERLYRIFLSARALLAAALIATLAAASLFGVPPAPPVVVGSVLYLLLAVGMRLALRRLTPASRVAPGRLNATAWLASIGADIVCFSLLHLLSRASSFNYAALLVLPVMMAGVLTPRLQALATAAGITLLLLGAAWLAVLQGGEATSLMTQAGLAGSGLFVITVLAGELAGRLAREELTAKGSMELARQQAQLNRLVIEEMQDGVLVVDRRGCVRAANPAARHLLAPRAAHGPAPFQLRSVAAWNALVTMVERAFVEGVWPEAGRDVVLDFGAANTRTLRVRVRFTRRRGVAETEEFCVLLLEDVRSLQARMRQEKLAAMGRVSAGIAHEIRNPLAAIAQANALMAEDATTPGQRQLTQLVSDNVERLKRIVDDVMEITPGEVHEAMTIDVRAQLAADCADWLQGVAAAEPDRAAAPSLLRLELPAVPLGAAFDAQHLRRVLINLLDNARRHVGLAPGAVQVRLSAFDDTRVELCVASDGAPIAAEVERYLFEPFFSTRSRGTGLGLYICRELCERYGASIDYRQRPAGQTHRNEFIVLMRQRPWPDIGVAAAGDSGR